jgi:hypothetical protein
LAVHNHSLSRKKGSTATVELETVGRTVITEPKEVKGRQKQGSWKIGAEELEVGKQAQTIVNSGSGPDYQICIPLGCAGPLVRVTYSGLIHKED